jgi:hypothetical protein
MKNALPVPWASTLLAFFTPAAKPRPENGTEFKTVRMGQETVPAKAGWANRLQDWLNIQVLLENGDLISLHLNKAYREGSYPLGGQSPHYATLETDGWLGQTYSTYSFHGGGYVHIQQISPGRLSGSFGFQAVVSTPDYDRPSDVLQISSAAFTVPILPAR